MAGRGVVATFALLPLVACGGEGDGRAGENGDAAEFCTMLAAGAGDVSTPEGMDDFRALVAAAPPELGDDLAIVVDVFENVDDVGESLDDGDIDDLSDVTEAMGDIAPGLFEVMLDPEVVVAFDALNAYAVDECGLEAPEESADPSTDASVDIGSIDPTRMSIDGLKQHIATESEIDIAEYHRGIGIALGRDAEITWAGPPDETLALCELALEYLTGFDAEATVEVLLLPLGSNDLVSDQERRVALGGGGEGEPCRPVEPDSALADPDADPFAGSATEPPSEFEVFSAGIAPYLDDHLGPDWSDHSLQTTSGTGGHITIHWDGDPADARRLCELLVDYAVDAYGAATITVHAGLGDERIDLARGDETGCTIV